MSLPPEVPGSVPSTPTCVRCGAALDGAAHFCANCGQPVTPGSYQAPPPYAQPYAQTYAQPYAQPHDQPFVPTPPATPGCPAPTYAGYQGFQPGVYGQYQQPVVELPKRGRRNALIVVAALVLLVVAAVASTLAVRHKKTTAAPASRSSASSIPAGMFRWDAGHFAVAFPNDPRQQDVPSTIAGVRITLHIAADSEDHVVVECEDISVPLPEAGQDQMRRIALGTMAGVGNMTIDSQTDITFQGRPARLGRFSGPNGQKLTGMVVGFSPMRIYMILAPTGEVYDRVAASFVALP